MAEIGFGVQAAAEQFNLKFVALTSEHYMLIYRQDRMPQATLQYLTELLKSPALVNHITGVSGYEPDSPGEITTFDVLTGGDVGGSP
jgi:molybdate-binding protein